MKYYSEETVKGLLEQMDSHFVKYLENLPSIEIKEPHGRCIDVNLLHKRLIEDVHTQDTEWLKKYKDIIYDVVTPIIVGCPTVIEATEGKKK